MDLYTLDSDFLPKDPIDSFSSVIWTERYSSAGDVNLVVDATSEMKSKLYPGTFLSHPESKEVMILETYETENDQLTVKGSSLLAFLNSRLVWLMGLSETSSGFAWFIPPEQAIHDTVFFMIYDTDVGDYPPLTLLNLDWPNEWIPNLTLESVAGIGGDPVEVVIPSGPLYDGIKPIAETHKLGLSLYLDSVDPAAPSYALKFRIYVGEDRTSDQVINELVRFSPHTDSLTNVKELNSIVPYKNVAYAYAPNEELQIAYLPGVVTPPVGFDRRVIMVPVDDIPEGPDAIVIADLLLQKAKDALANNNHVKMVDGEVLPNEYQFGTDYNLGDTIELESVEGAIQKARITEYIRSQDATGERAYPTVSVVD